MELLKVEGLSFAYPNESELTLEDVSFSVNKGEFVLLCGKSGSGKTTLIRQLKTVLTGYGKKSGSIFYEGKPLEEYSEREQAMKIGFVMQDPNAQIVTDKVWHELAFGIESLGMPQQELRLRIAEVSAFFGMEGVLHMNTSELSGGQKQILTLASITAQRPELIVLDEPLSQLDPASAESFLTLLVKLNRELGVTVIISEHNTEYIMSFCTRLLVLENGRLICDDIPKSAVKALRSNSINKIFPVSVRVFNSVGGTEDPPFTINEGRAYLEKLQKKDSVHYSKAEHDFGTAIEVKELCFGYEKEKYVIYNCSFKVYKGEFFSILGQNGSGKTTLLTLLSGINKQDYGKINKNGSVFYIPQFPLYLFSKDSIEKELYSVSKDRANDIISRFRLEDIRHRHPADISGGELQRAAIALAVLYDSDIIIVDEPTKGMDAESRDSIGNELKNLTKDGKTVITVSHDMEFCASFADRCGMFFDKQLINISDTHSFFCSNMLYTTSARKLSEGMIDDAVTCEEVIGAIGGKETFENSAGKRGKLKQEMISLSEKAEKAGEKRFTLSAVLIFLVIPALIFLGINVFDDRKYYFISTAILFTALIPFFSVFENRAVKTRELVIMAVMCAMCVIGRIAFFMVIAFKPVAALVIIAGVSLGAEAGFTVGAMGGFLSNFYFGQGPWTPWQMFCYGIIGFLSGLMYKTGLLKKHRLGLSVYGFVCIMLIYGGIMNPASVFMSMSDVDMGHIFTAYAVGIPYDLIHAVGTAIFMFFLADPIISRLERIKIKYGILT